MLRIPLDVEGRDAVRERYARRMTELETKLQVAQIRSSEAEEAELAAEARASLANVLRRDRLLEEEAASSGPARERRRRRGACRRARTRGSTTSASTFAAAIARLGRLVPRHFPRDPRGRGLTQRSAQGSGRLELARWIAAARASR